MNHVLHNSLVNFIWGIADDVLRDVYVRGKYRDVILPMTVTVHRNCWQGAMYEALSQSDWFCSEWLRNEV